MAAKQAAEKLISSHKVAVFSKTYCPYCSKTKSTLQGLNVPNVGILELDNESNGSDIQAYLKDKTGQNSVPNVFINGKHIGGNSDLQELHSKGELQKLIAA
jgi:glutaredoxin 3